MANEGKKRARVATTLPPRTLNVQKFAESRATELEALHSIVADRLSNDFRSQRNKRRRTTGHDNRMSKRRWRKKQKSGVADEAETLSTSKDEKKVSRRVLRRMGLKGNPPAGFCTSADGTKRLRTHLWHAKRFAIMKRWGFYIPLGLQGRGRGSRSLLRWFKHGVLVHDASYISAVQLEGPEDSILSILRMVMVSSPSVCLEGSPSVCSGVSYGRAMLHHVGAPSSQLIAPVTYMWRPMIKNNVDFESGNATALATDSTTQRSAGGSEFRQLWVWIHAAAFSEGSDALACAIKKQMDDTGISVSCSPLEGKLAKLELMGSKTLQILKRILHPVSETPEVSFPLRNCSVGGGSTDTQLQKFSILENLDHFPSGTVLSLTVKDPRDLPKKGIEGVLEAQSVGQESNEPEKCTGDTSLTASAACHVKINEIISSLWSKPELNSIMLSDNKDLWDGRNMLNPPLDENLLSKEKHKRRMSFFYLDNSNTGVSSCNAKQFSSSCPILLLNDHNVSGSCPRWSIILPLSWVKAFWIPLVSNGAHAIGYREKHHIACEVGLPSFPFDFPDCQAYKLSMAEEASAFDEKVELRPPAVRPSNVPTPPPWGSVRCTFSEEFTDARDTQAEVCNGEIGPAISLINSDSKHCDSTSLEQDGSSFEGFVARTSNILFNYFSKVHDGNLLLCPRGETDDEDFTVSLSNEGKPNCNLFLAKQIMVDHKLCFIRVHLRAYKEGVFEEGAVVCAPHLSDISLWISRSDEQGGRLQIPASSIGSYFTQLPCGKWELSEPEGPAARELHRWPVGFITTGFVRGSTKPVAEAFCEAALLGKLRREQWGRMERQQKHEIIVLVRNLRSAAYRLALATIVLEHQEEDMEFM